MDYKTYLDFVLAIENKKEPAALQYLFKLLDIQVLFGTEIYSCYPIIVDPFWQRSVTKLGNYRIKSKFCCPKKSEINRSAITG